MPLALNTGHALYNNIVELIAVQGGAPVSLKNARTFTNRTNAPTFGTGALGEYMRTDGNSFAWSGVTFSPNFSTSQGSSSNGSTIMLIASSFSEGGQPYGDVNNFTIVPAISGGRPLMYAGSNPASGMTGRSAQTGPVVTGGSPHSIAFVHPPGDTVLCTAYSDGVVAETATTPSFGSVADIASIGGPPGQGGTGMDFVYLVMFDKVLTQAEILALHNSLGASNAFALLASTASPVITGPTGTAGASSITHTVNENQAAAGTWTVTDGVSWSLTGTDAAALSISGGVVTKASGNFDFETKASYSFNVVNGSASQAVTLNITNLPEPSSPTKSTPTSTTAVIGATVDVSTGTLYGVLTLDNSPPSVAQVKAGQNAAGSNATTVVPTALTITSAGAKSFAAAAVVSGTTRYGWIVLNSGGNDSAVLAVGALYPGTGRPAAGVTASGGWVASTGTDLGAVMNEDAPGSNAEYMTTPTLTGSYQDKDIPLTQPYPAGTYNNLKFTVRNNGGNATAKVSLLDAGGTVLATSGDQALTSGSFGTITIPTVTLTGTATQWRFSAKTP